MDAPAECRALAGRARQGAFATNKRDRDGWPFVTLVAVAFDEGLRPLFCLSALAEHTKNLMASPRGALLVTSEPEDGEDALAAGRMTLTGSCERVPDDEASAARRVFLSAHPEAAGYVSFADFAMWRMAIVDVWWVGGFGRMEWVGAEAFAPRLR